MEGGGKRGEEEVTGREVASTDNGKKDLLISNVVWGAEGSNAGLGENISKSFVGI